MLDSTIFSIYFTNESWMKQAKHQPITIAHNTQRNGMEPTRGWQIYNRDVTIKLGKIKLREKHSFEHKWKYYAWMEK